MKISKNVKLRPFSQDLQQKKRYYNNLRIILPILLISSFKYAYLTIINKIDSVNSIN